MAIDVADVHHRHYAVDRRGRPSPVHHRVPLVRGGAFVQDRS